MPMGDITPQQPARLGRYDASLQMFVEEHDLDQEHLSYLKWLADNGRFGVHGNSAPAEAPFTVTDALRGDGPPIASEPPTLPYSGKPWSTPGGYTASPPSSNPD